MINNDICKLINDFKFKIRALKLKVFKYLSDTGVLVKNLWGFARAVN